MKLKFKLICRSLAADSPTHRHRYSVGMALALSGAVLLAGCQDASSPSVVGSDRVVTTSGPATAQATEPAKTSSQTSDCVKAIQQLRQCHQKTASSGKASAVQLERSSTYLRRLEAWWKMDGGNPAIQATCKAFASGEDGCEADAAPDGEESGMSEAQFRMVMKQFDDAGVPP